MVSPEILKRYPFYSFMDHDQLRDVAMITDEIKYKKDQVLFNTDEKADACFLLMEGSVDLHYVVVDEHDPSMRKEFVVGTINPGELLGISAFVEPHIYTATAFVVNDSRLLKMDAVALRDLCRQDLGLNLGFQTVAVKATMERLHATRVQLAAAKSPE
jgi:CRP-like cAMP-binding protein